MLRNYIKIAWRNIRRHPFYSMVNIIGLSAGIVFALLIGAFVWGELRVNKTLRNADRQYFLMSEWKDPNQGADITTLAPLGRRLKEDYPNLVANYYRWDGITSVVSKGDKHLREGIQLGDSTLLSMYGFELLHGDKRTALNGPTSVVITKQTAIKYFGKSDVVGQTLTIQSFSGTKQEFAITGVLKDLPPNSVTQINADNHNNLFIPISAMTFFGRAGSESWANIWTPSYIELQKGVKPSDLEKPIRQLLDQNASDIIKSTLKVNPVLLSEFYLGYNRGLIKRMLYNLSYVGLFILLMAIINFINITISSSSSRLREIGIRKVLGGLRKQLMIQFFTESILLVLFSTLFALVLFPICQPLFNEMVGKSIPSLGDFPVYFALMPLLLVLIVGLLAGSYPAWILSSLKSVDSLKGKLKTIRENAFLRKSLVGVQFGIALVVLIIAIVVTQQVAYFFSKSLGFNKEFIVSAQLPRDWSPAGVRKIEQIRDQFAAMPVISQASVAYEIPNGMNGGQPPVYKFGTDSSSAIAMQSMVTDGYYASTFQLPLKAGSYFNQREPIDSSKIVLNENAVKALGWNSPEEAIGKQVRMPGSSVVFSVQGVINDFHFTTMQEKIQPMIIFHLRIANAYRFMALKVKPGNMGETIESIEKKWAALLPGSSFEYSFMDDSLKRLYMTELQIRKASYTASALTLIIVLLGVLGLISLNIRKRTKEIGIRKVLGSSVSSIIGLFMKEFMYVVLIAAVVASPLAYFIVKGWLNDYAYRIDLTALPFLSSIAVLGGLIALLITFQTIKAGIANPVKSLRTE